MLGVRKQANLQLEEGVLVSLAVRESRCAFTAAPSTDILSSNAAAHHPPCTQKDVGEPGEGDPDPASVGLAGRRNLQSLSAAEAIVDALEMAAAEAARLEEHRKEKKARAWCFDVFWRCSS